MITLPEEFLLLAHDERGGIGFGEVRHIQHALIGSALEELILQRRVSESLGRIRVMDPAPTGERGLDLVLEALRRHEGPPPDAGRWISSLPRDLLEDVREAVGMRLAARGIVTREEMTRLGRKRTEYPPTDARVLHALRARVRAVVGGGGSDRELALARMIDAAERLSAVYPEPLERERARATLAQRAPEQPIADAIAHVGLM